MAFTAAEPGLLQKYRFGLKTADFLLCRQCGVYVGALIESGGTAFGIVNIHALKNAPAKLAPTAPISYDDEDTGGRFARREHRWTPVSEYPG
jgi:hypothetical protein